MWHFFSNPSPTLSSSLVELSKVSATGAEGHVPITGWGLPDTSIIANAPAEYIVYLKENKTAAIGLFTNKVLDAILKHKNQTIFLCLCRFRRPPVPTKQRACVELGVLLLKPTTKGGEYMLARWRICLTTRSTTPKIPPSCLLMLFLFKESIFIINAANCP